MGSGGTRVIIVEDHRAIRDFLRPFVEGVDHCLIVAEAVCGMEAIDVIHKVPADLIILDLSLPSRSGLEVLREAKKVSAAKVLAFTMSTDPDHIQAALDAGADGICLKDRGLPVLKKAIMEVLDGKRPMYLED